MINLSLDDKDWDLLLELVGRGCDIIGDFSLLDKLQEKAIREVPNQTKENQMDWMQLRNNVEHVASALSKSDYLDGKTPEEANALEQDVYERAILTVGMCLVSIAESLEVLKLLEQTRLR